MDPGALREALRPVQEALAGLQDAQASMQELLIARMALSAEGGPPPAQSTLATGARRTCGMLLCTSSWRHMPTDFGFACCLRMLCGNLSRL